MIKWFLTRQGIMVIVLLTFPVFLLVFYLSGLMPLGVVIALTLASFALAALNIYDKMKDRKKDASDLIDKAQAMMKRGEFKGAAAVFRRALKVDVESYDAHYGLAFSCKSMLDFAEAEESFKAALALRPSSAEAHYSLGTMYFGLGKFSEAAAELVEAVDLDMKLHDAYYFLGEASGKLGDMEKAKDYFKRFSNLCPSSPHFTKVQQRLKEIERTEGSGASTRSPR